MSANTRKPERRLAAIMATDVVGYSRRMLQDEAATLVALGAIHEKIKKLIHDQRGRIANTAGDSVMAEFGSAVEAVTCATTLQQELSSHIETSNFSFASVFISEMWLIEAAI